MKYLIGIIVVVCFALVGGYVYTRGIAPAQSPASSTPTVFTPLIEKVLADQTSLLQALAGEPALIAEVRSTGEKNKDITQAQILTLDQEWQNAVGITPFIKTFLENPTAERLLSFQREHPGLKEIFVTDTRGRKVGQTDKTSDYYQADEAWWTDSFAGGTGAVLHGGIEFDASSQTQAISIYVPVLDPATGKALGVIKGVLDVSSISNEL